MFDLSRLRLLRELSHLGTMTAVAAAVRLTPSAVSQQLATLEAEAGVKLIEPVGRGVRLTSAGQRLADHAEIILGAVKAARLDMGAASTDPAGRLEIGCFATFAKARLLGAITRLRTRHPALDIIVRELEPVDALHAVRTGGCDACIVYEHGLVPREIDASHVVHHLADDPMLLALPARLGQLPPEVELGSLRDCGWIGGARESEGDTLTRRACALAGFAPRITHAIDDYDLLMRMVAAGLGVSFVPRIALDLYPYPGIAVRTAVGAALTRRISLVSRPVMSSSPSLAALLEELRAGLG